jgi:uncharacterized membrane protein YcaP (DUF421 family)
MDALTQTFDSWLGLSVQPHDLRFSQMTLRALVVFVAALPMLRIAHKRFFATRNALDVLLAFVLASTLARAINGAAAFWPTLGVCYVLVIVHNALTWATCRWHPLGRLLKGNTVELVRDGAIDHAALRKHHISEHDLAEDLRMNGALADAGRARRAVLERSGDISVIRTPHVRTVAVEHGVQTVRIEIEG